jgi:transposase-like protein
MEIPNARAASRDLIYYRNLYDREVIKLYVRWYLTYRLSYRDLSAMMAERNVAVTHTTIMRWVHRFVPEFERRWSRFSKPSASSWRMDETNVSIRAMALSLSSCRSERKVYSLSTSREPHDRLGAGILFARRWQAPDGRRRSILTVTPLRIVLYGCSRRRMCAGSASRYERGATSTMSLNRTTALSLP